MKNSGKLGYDECGGSAVVSADTAAVALMVVALIEASVVVLLSFLLLLLCLCYKYRNEGW